MVILLDLQRNKEVQRMKIEFTSQDAVMVYGFLASFAVPWLVSFLKQIQWNRYVKLGLAFGTCVAAALLSLYAAGVDFTLYTVTGMIFAVFGLATANYKTWFTELGLDDVLTSVSISKLLEKSE